MQEPAGGPDVSDDAPRVISVPAVALHALRAAALGGDEEGPAGELRLRDAGYAAGVAMYDDLGAFLRAGGGGSPDADPAALPLPRFTAALEDYLETCGWGAARVRLQDAEDVLRVVAPDWAEADWADADRDAPAAFPACHFSTGLLAGLFGRAAHRPLAVLEVACRAAGADRCEFAVGSRAVMDALWERLRERGRERESAGAQEGT